MPGGRPDVPGGRPDVPVAGSGMRGQLLAPVAGPLELAVGQRAGGALDEEGLAPVDAREAVVVQRAEAADLAADPGTNFTWTRVSKVTTGRSARGAARSIHSRMPRPSWPCGRALSDRVRPGALPGHREGVGRATDQQQGDARVDARGASATLVTLDLGARFPHPVGDRLCHRRGCCRTWTRRRSGRSWPLPLRLTSLALLRGAVIGPRVGPARGLTSPRGCPGRRRRGGRRAGPGRRSRRPRRR